MEILCVMQHYCNPLSSKEILPAIFYDDGNWELLGKDISSQVFHDQFSCKLAYSTWIKNNVLVPLMDGIAWESFQIIGDCRYPSFLSKLKRSADCNLTS